MKTKHAVLAVIGTIVIVGAFMLVGGANYINNIGGSNPAGVTVFPPQPSNPGSTYKGNVAFSVVGSNIGNGSSLTADTNFDVEYFAKAGDIYTKISLETDGTESIPIGDNDIVYAQVTIPANQAFLMDWVSTLTANPNGLVKKPAYVDITKDGVIDYLYPLDVSPLRQAGMGNPNLVPPFPYYLKFHGDQTLSLDAPSDKLSVGTGTKSSTITWQASMDTQPGTDAIKAFQITVNGTRATNEVAEEQSFINFPFGNEASGYKKIYLSDPAFSISEDFTVSAFNATGSNEDAQNGKTIMRYTISSQIDGADFITVATQGTKQVPISLTVETNMDASNDGVCLELRIEPINARNVVGTALTDDVELAEGSSNAVVCTV